jgi:hypothetical protein
MRYLTRGVEIGTVPADCRSMILQDPRRQTMGKGSEKVRTNAKKNKLREKAKRLISEGKKLTGELVRYDPRHRKAT